MRNIELLRMLSVAALVALIPTQSATARRTVVDGGSLLDLSGYCSPESANTSDCAPYTLPVAIQLGGSTYNSFWVNSNGTVSLGSIEAFLGPQNVDPPISPQGSLFDYGSVPIFSPNFADGRGYFDFTTGNYDGNFIAQTALTATGFSVDWFECTDPLACGPITATLAAGVTFDPSEVGTFGLVDALISRTTLNDPNATDLQNFLSGQQALISEANNSPVFNMTLTGLGSGFEVDYNYNSAAEALFGVYGYNLPNAQFETFSNLSNRTYVFDSTGSLVTGVPEPSTWMSMLLGFGLVGFALRRGRRLAQAPA